MKYILLFFLIIGCSENNNSYFPLEKIKSWTYKVEIQPEVEKKTIYKKVNLSLGKKKIKVDGEKKNSFHYLEKMAPFSIMQLIKKEFIGTALRLQRTSQ